MPTVHLSRQKEAFFRGYGQIRLLFTLSLIHDLSEECRQVFHRLALDETPLPSEKTRNHLSYMSSALISCTDFGP